MSKIRADELAKALGAELETYQSEIGESIKDAVNQVAKECRDEISANSPRKTKRYMRGWRVKKLFDGIGGIRVVVYNKTDYQLTHLLEYGHAKISGGRVEGKPHIAPAEQKAQQKIVKRIESAVKKL